MNTECWIDYVYPYMELLESSEFRRRFVRCLGVQETVENTVWRYIGHRDQRWVMHERVDYVPRQAVIDVKTGSCLPMTGLQLAFYDMDGVYEPRRARFGLRLRPGKSADLIEFNDTRDYDRAKILVKAWWVASDYRGDKMRTWPSATQILSWARLYEGFPDEPYYLKRGTWVGDCCDIIAQGKELDEQTIAFGRIPRKKPLGRGDDD